jgi:hypothetical protein
VRAKKILVRKRPLLCRIFSYTIEAVFKNSDSTIRAYNQLRIRKNNQVLKTSALCGREVVTSPLLIEATTTIGLAVITLCLLKGRMQFVRVVANFHTLTSGLSQTVAVCRRTP